MLPSLPICYFLTSRDKMSLLTPTYFRWNFNIITTKYVSTIHFRETTYVYGTIFLKCDISLAINIQNVMHLRILSILSRNSKTWYLSSAEWCSCFDLVSHWSRSSCKAFSWWTAAATFLVLVFREEEVEVEADVKVEPEPLNRLSEIPSTLSLETAPLIWDKSGDEKKLFIELSPLFTDKPLELGRDILCGTNDDIRELSPTLEIKHACLCV